jgi:hypothetical protein
MWQVCSSGEGARTSCQWSFCASYAMCCLFDGWSVAVFVISEAHHAFFSLNGNTFLRFAVYSLFGCDERLMLEHDSFGVHYALEKQKINFDKTPEVSAQCSVQKTGI